MISRLNNLYSREQIPNVSFREYFDLIKIGYYYSNSNIVLVFKFPIIRPATYDLYRLSIVPNKENKVLIPSHPYLAIHDKDSMYIEAECPKSSSLGYLCEERINHHGSQADCIFQLITMQRVDKSCQFTSITLTNEAVEQLDDRHYILSFPSPTKIRLSCIQDQYDTVRGSFLATIPKGCLLQTTEFTIINNEDRIKGQVMKIMNMPPETIYKVDERKIKFKSIDLRKLHDSNTEMYLETPFTISRTETKNLYYTIAPLYILMLSACALIIWFTVRHLQGKRRRHVINPDRNKEVEADQPGLSAIFSSLARQ